MKKMIAWLYATSIMYDHISHACDLIQARGDKRLFEYHSLKCRAFALALMRRMANREWQTAFPGQAALKRADEWLTEYGLNTFAYTPGTVPNDKYSATVKSVISLCLSHNVAGLDALNAEVKSAPVEDFKVYEAIAEYMDDLCKELRRVTTLYGKYDWNAAYIANDEKIRHDSYEKLTESEFKMYFT